MLFRKGSFVSFVVLIGYVIFAYTTINKYKGRKDFLSSG